MLMMFMTPKMSVNPVAISAYTAPVRIPSITAWVSAVPFTYSSRPYWLGKENRNGVRLTGRHDLNEVRTLPLEGERNPQEVLTQVVELHRTLNALHGDPAVEIADDLRVVEAAGRLHRLSHHLADRVGLSHIGIHI